MNALGSGGRTMTALDELGELVRRFEYNKEAYSSARYNEAQVRQELIDPMFRLLGWDMDNARG